MQVRSLALLSGLGIQHSHELWCRLQMRLGSRIAALWCRLAASIRPLAWEPPYAMGTALKKQKKNKKNYLRTNMTVLKSAVFLSEENNRLDTGPDPVQ